MHPPFAVVAQYGCDFTTYTGMHWLLTTTDFIPQTANADCMKHLIFDQTRQNEYQTVEFSVCIHNLMLVSFGVSVRKIV